MCSCQLLFRYAESVESVFVIGGGTIYAEALRMSSLCERVYLTEVSPTSAPAEAQPLKEVNGVPPSAAPPEAALITECGANGPFNCDVFFPAMAEAEWVQTKASTEKDENSLRYRFLTFEPKARANAAERVGRNADKEPRHEEYQYLDLVREVLDHGVSRSDRTGVGTIGKFGVQMRFSLRERFPLLTTKRVFWRGVAEELLWCATLPHDGLSTCCAHRYITRSPRRPRFGSKRLRASSLNLSCMAQP